MKEYIKPRLVVHNLKLEGLLDFAVSGDGDGTDQLSKRNKKIIEDAEYLSEDVSFEKEGIDSEL